MLQRYMLISDIEGAALGIVEHEHAVLQRCDQIIIELHDVNRDTQLIAIEQLAERFEAHGFKLRDRLRSVFVFERG